MQMKIADYETRRIQALTSVLYRPAADGEQVSENKDMEMGEGILDDIYEL